LKKKDNPQTPLMATIYYTETIANSSAFSDFLVFSYSHTFSKEQLDLSEPDIAVSVWRSVNFELGIRVAGRYIGVVIDPVLNAV
jgi:hypothetical protein